MIIVSMPHDFKLFGRDSPEFGEAKVLISEALTKVERTTLEQLIATTLADMVGNLSSDAIDIHPDPKVTNSDFSSFDEAYEWNLDTAAASLCRRLNQVSGFERLFGGPLDAEDDGIRETLRSILDLVATEIAVHARHGTIVDGNDGDDFRFHRRFMCLVSKPGAESGPEAAQSVAMGFLCTDLENAKTRSQLESVRSRLLQLLVYAVGSLLVQAVVLVGLPDNHQLGWRQQLDGFAQSSSPSWTERPCGEYIGVRFVAGDSSNSIWRELVRSYELRRRTFAIPETIHSLLSSSDCFVSFPIRGLRSNLAYQASRYGQLWSGLLSLALEIEQVGEPRRDHFEPVEMDFHEDGVPGDWIFSSRHRVALDLPAVFLVHYPAESVDELLTLHPTSVTARLPLLETPLTQEDLAHTIQVYEALLGEATALPFLRELLTFTVRGTVIEACRTALEYWSAAETKFHYLVRHGTTSSRVASAALDYFTVMEVLAGNRGATTEVLAARNVAAKKYLKSRFMQPFMGARNWEGIHSRIKKLYDKRSSRVHAGETRFTAGDLAKLRRDAADLTLAFIGLVATGAHDESSEAPTGWEVLDLATARGWLDHHRY